MTQSTQTPVCVPVQALDDTETTSKFPDITEAGPISGQTARLNHALPGRNNPHFPYAATDGIDDKNARARGDSMHPVAFSRDATLHDSVPPSHEYEPLTGGTGREIYYRQARYAVADLLGKHSDIDHYVKFGSLVGKIVDFGINGLAFSLKEEAPARDNIVEDFRVVIGNDTLYEGRALIRYCRRETNSRITVGVVLLDGIMDTDAMVMAKNRALSAKTATSLSETLEAGVSQQYKEAMADLVLLLSSYRELLDSQERSILTLSASSARERAEGEVLGIATMEFGAQYDRYRRRCNDLTSGLVGGAKQAHRKYTEAVLHPYVLSAPLPHHCYCKPLGYPGDYMLMSYLYNPQPYGKTLYDKLIHQVIVRDEPMAIGVQRRKDFLLDQIRQVTAEKRAPNELPFRILSLACGPAQEVLEYATEYRESCSPTVFTLIDQDQRSLTHVNSCLSRLLIPGSTNIGAKYLYLGFMQMIAELDAFDSLPAQDLIYAAGLFDYIKIASAQQLAQRLFEKLSRGGRLVIGNFKSPNDATWALEYWMDWHLIYRNHDDMRAIAELIDEPHNVELACDASGYTNMLIVTRG